jgi:hypothetical protein
MTERGRAWRCATSASRGRGRLTLVPLLQLLLVEMGRLLQLCKLLLRELGLSVRGKPRSARLSASRGVAAPGSGAVVAFRGAPALLPGHKARGRRPPTEEKSAGCDGSTMVGTHDLPISSQGRLGFAFRSARADRSRGAGVGDEGGLFFFCFFWGRETKGALGIVAGRVVVEFAEGLLKGAAARA